MPPVQIQQFSRVLLEDLKQLENTNSTAANNVSSEQLHTVTEIKREWFNMKLDTKTQLKGCISSAVVLVIINDD